VERPEVPGQVVDEESGDNQTRHRRSVDVTERTVPARTFGVHDDHSTGPDRDQREGHMHHAQRTHVARHNQCANIFILLMP